MKTLQTMKNGLIHILGGYTEKEFERQGPKIAYMNPRPVTFTAHQTIPSTLWAITSEKHLLNERIKKELFDNLRPQIIKTMKLSGPNLVSPEFYGFSLSVTIIPPLDWRAGECLSE